MKRIEMKILMVAVAFLGIIMLASPVLAIGPTNIPENKNPNLISEGINTQIWLPSGVMNEWIEAPVVGDLKVTIKRFGKIPD